MIRGSLIVHVVGEGDDLDDLLAVIDRHPTVGNVEWLELPDETPAPGKSTDELKARADELGRRHAVGGGYVPRRRRDIDGPE